MSLLMQLVRCYGSRQEFLSQNVQNREAVSRLRFPRSHTTMCAHTQVHTHPEGVVSVVEIHYSPSQFLIQFSSCRVMYAVTVPLHRDMWVNKTDHWSQVMHYSLVYLIYKSAKLASYEKWNIAFLKYVFRTICLIWQQLKIFICTVNVAFWIGCSSSFYFLRA